VTKFKRIQHGLRETDPRVFRRAAATMLKDAKDNRGSVFSCCSDLTCATVEAGMGLEDRIQHAEWFQDLFKPEFHDDGSYWWYRFDSEPRILALLLAELIAKENRRELRAGRIPRHL
jgi:hypothetical protein